MRAAHIFVGVVMTLIPIAYIVLCLGQWFNFLPNPYAFEIIFHSDRIVSTTPYAAFWFWGSFIACYCGFMGLSMRR